jgi:hypothetical protein
MIYNKKNINDTYSDVSKAYNKIYNDKFLDNPFNWVEYKAYYFLCKFHNFIKSILVSWNLRLSKNRKNIKNTLKNNPFATDYSERDPLIKKYLTLDPTKERIYQTNEVNGIFFDLHNKTNGEYTKDEFKIDLFGHLLKKKKDTLNIV